MNILLNFFLGAYLFFALCLTPVLAQGVHDKWDTLNNLADQLVKSGDYEQAIMVAKKALNVAEKTLGSDHPHVAESLDKLAWVHYKRGEYAQAESLLNRALAIWENAGPDYQLQHCISIKQLGLVQLETGRNRESLKMLQRALGVCRT